MEPKISVVKQDMKDVQEMMYSRILAPLTLVPQLWIVDDGLAEIQKLLDDENVADEFTFSHKSLSKEITELAERATNFTKHVVNLFEDISDEIDQPFLEDMESFTSAVEKISIDKYPVKNTNSLSVEGTTWEPGVSISAPSTPVKTFSTPDKLTFSDLMNTSLSRQMKQQQYEMFLQMNNLADMDYSYDNFINNMYRRSEFDYKTRAGKIEGVVTTGLVVVCMMGIIVTTGGLATGVAIPAATGTITTVAGTTLTVYNGYKLLRGKDIDDNNLTEYEKNELMKNLKVDIAFMVAGFGLNKILKHANKIDVPEKVSGANATRIKRTQADLDDLARDPSHGGNITKGSGLERDIGLALEERGDLGHIVRDKIANGGAEFIDTITGKKYDVKSFVSYPNGHTSPKKGAFTVDRAMKNIMKELDRGHDLIINTTNLTPEHRAMLINELKNKGLIDKIIFYP